MQEIPNFWDNTHPLSNKAEELYVQLVPGVGKCETLQGELLRAASKIAYDWYNNGWGCNNWSGAVIFLRDNIADLPVLAPDAKSDDFHHALREVHGYSHGEPVDFEDKEATSWVTVIEEYVVSKILANPEPIQNDKDMMDFREPDYVPDDDDSNWDDDFYYDEEEDDGT